MTDTTHTGQTPSSAAAPSGAPAGVLKGVSWALQAIAAAILAMAALPKLTGQAEAVHLFETLGAEPAGRYLVGLAEAAAVVLLLVPRTVPVGALLALVLMVGAIGSHLTKLGIAMTGPDGQSDGGMMFAMAIIVLLAGAGVVVIRRAQIPVIGPMLSGRAG
jgi:putative oxidoreductase